MPRRPTVQEPDVTRLPPAAAQSLGELIAYAEGAIVSRILVQNRAGSVTLFAFDKGQGLSEHTAPFDALVHILDGKAKLTIGGKPIPAVAGQVVLMPAEVPHALHAAERFRMLLTMLRGED
jgi:quercetin dioxygenase-like cupin family protein